MYDSLHGTGGAQGDTSLFDEVVTTASSLLACLDQAVIVLGASGTITTLNPEARALFSIGNDVPAEQLSLADFGLLDRSGRPLNDDQHPLATGQIAGRSDVGIPHRSGLRRAIVQRSSMGGGDERFATVVTFRILSDDETTVVDLRHRASHDPLTGVGNREKLRERLTSLNSLPTSTRVAACFIDIDHFKRVNDVHGHTVGDIVLHSAAQRIQSQLRDGDTIIRTGGDEFLVLIEAPLSPGSAVELAERIRTSLARPFNAAGTQLFITTSIGVAFHDTGTLSETSIMASADTALYAAKERGRDRVEVYSESLATRVRSDHQRQKLVRDSLEAGQVAAHFQPVINRNGHTVGVEAVSRCVTSDGSLVSPKHFMEAIDGSDLMVELDHESFRQACELALHFAGTSTTQDLFVSANFSATSLNQPGFFGKVMQTMRQTGAPARTLCLEIPEIAALEADETARESLVELQDVGVRIALDHVGLGYSSLSHWCTLPISMVKIDHDVLHSECPRTARAMVAAINGVAASLGLTVVAEGIETPRDRQLAGELGIDNMQGWGFSPALDVAELFRFLETEQRLLPMPLPLL